MSPPSNPNLAGLRRQAFALAGQVAGRGEAAAQLLHDLAGQESLSGLGATEWRTLIARLEDSVIGPVPPGCTRKQWTFILGLRRKLNMSDTHWRNWLAQQFSVDHERFLRTGQFRGVITALLRMLERQTPGGPVGAA